MVSEFVQAVYCRGDNGTFLALKVPPAVKSSILHHLLPTPHPQTGVPLPGQITAAERGGGARSCANTSAPAISLLAGCLHVSLSHLHMSPQQGHASSHPFTPARQPHSGFLHRRASL